MPKTGRISYDRSILVYIATSERSAIHQLLQRIRHTRARLSHLAHSSLLGFTYFGSPTRIISKLRPDAL